MAVAVRDGIGLDVRPSRVEVPEPSTIQIAERLVDVPEIFTRAAPVRRFSPEVAKLVYGEVIHDVSRELAARHLRCDLFKVRDDDEIVQRVVGSIYDAFGLQPGQKRVRISSARVPVMAAVHAAVAAEFVLHDLDGTALRSHEYGCEVHTQIRATEQIADAFGVHYIRGR